jgi:hypothetical protein
LIPVSAAVSYNVRVTWAGKRRSSAELNPEKWKGTPLDPLKIRSRKFDGRCGRHKRYNPATDGRPSAEAGCQRCHLLFEIWESSLALNGLIRKFNPRHDDLKKLAPKAPPHDPRQLSLIVDGVL